MVGDQLFKFQSKVNSSIEGNFSTFESTSSKKKKKQKIRLTNSIEQRSFQRDIEQVQIRNNQKREQKIDEQMQNRLFTFMDEKDHQKKMIQDFLLSRTNRHQYLSESNQENNALLLNRANAQIQRIIEDSKKKQEKSIGNSLNIISTYKQLKSSRKQSNTVKSRTPKRILKSSNKFLTIDVRNESKTQRNQLNRSITPRYEKQQRLIRVKSNLDYSHLNRIDYVPKKQIKQARPKKYRQKGDLRKVEQYNISVKQLIKKKKQLEKQLIQINSSLVWRKKKITLTNKISNQKPSNLKTLKNRKRSISRLGIC